MKPDRFEILVCLSGIAVVALITTAAFGMATNEPLVDCGSNGVKASPAMFASAPHVRRANSEWSTASRNNEGRRVVSFSALTTHYSPSPNSPFDGAMIIRGRRGTMCEVHGGEAWSFARRPKQQEMTSRAPFAATYGTFHPGLDVLLIHLLEATDVTLPGESTLV